MEGFVIIFIIIFLTILTITTIIKTAIVIPQMSVFVIEKLGKYNRTLSAGFHILIPFIDKIAYRHSLKEKTINVPEQVCITKDNIPVAVDGFLYLQITDPQKASYGINDYLFATTQLTQTTMRSIIGKLDLDQTFEYDLYIALVIYKANISFINIHFYTLLIFLIFDVIYYQMLFFHTILYYNSSITYIFIGYNCFIIFEKPSPFLYK